MLCEFVAAVLCTTQLAPEILALSRIKRHVEERLSHAPDYVCLETVERSTRRSMSQEFKATDVFQLEVGHAGKQEVYSWPGSDAFVPQFPAEAVGAGMFSTGEFDAHLRTIFQSNATAISYLGEEDLHGRRTLHYTFRVPAFAAGFRISVAGQSGQAAETGSFWADAESLEVLRVEVQADEIPPNVPVTGVVTRIDYARVAIGPRYAWLPQAAESLMTNVTGKQDRNRIEFSHCRQFQASRKTISSCWASTARSAGSIF